MKEINFGLKVVLKRYISIEIENKFPRFCSASIMFAEARIDGFNAIILKRIASLLSRL